MDPVVKSELIDACEGFAFDTLQRRGTLLPFGARADAEGSVGFVAFDDGGEGGHDTYRFAMESFAQMAQEGEASAVALAADVNLPAELGSARADAVRIHVEAPGTSRYVYFPYALEKSGFLGLKRTLHRDAPIEIDAPATFFA